MLMKACFILAAAGSRRRLAVALTTTYLSTSAPRHRHIRLHHSSCVLYATTPGGSRDGRSVRYSNTISPSVQDRIQDLISHPAVVWDESSTFASMHKKKLGRRHLELFNREDSILDGSDYRYDQVFDKFARSVCHAGVVARKEVFETWASALYIYSSFLSNEESSEINNYSKPIKRVADIAAGHGLLAWALLILDDEYQKNHGNDESHHVPLTAFCLDVQMPRSAELIHASMIQQYPHLRSKFDYVEGRLEQLVPDSSCLLASVHACGILSDVLVSTAAEHGVPLAVVPCCHSRKRKVLDVASPFAKDLYNDIILNNNNKGTRMSMDLADQLDGARMVALENAGQNVAEVFLPKMFTGKNRLIMGFPSKFNQPTKSLLSLSDNDEAKVPEQKVSMRKGHMPPLNTTPSSSSIMPKARFLKGFYVPCKDDEENRQIVSNLAGRAAAINRKEVMHNRNHTKSPQMDLSLWLPEEDAGLSEDALSRIIETNNNVKCTVSKLGSVYVNPEGRRAQTFRFQYEY